MKYFPIIQAVPKLNSEEEYIHNQVKYCKSRDEMKQCLKEIFQERQRHTRKPMTTLNFDKLISKVHQESTKSIGEEKRKMLKIEKAKKKIDIELVEKAQYHLYQKQIRKNVNIPHFPQIEKRNLSIIKKHNTRINAEIEDSLNEQDKKIYEEMERIYS